jgi:hypothetical protein
MKTETMTVRLPSFILRYINQRSEKNPNQRLHAIVCEHMVQKLEFNAPHTLDYLLTPSNAKQKLAQMIEHESHGVSVMLMLRLTRMLDSTWRDVWYVQLTSKFTLEDILTALKTKHKE